MKFSCLQVLTFTLLLTLVFFSCQKKEAYLSFREYDLVAEELWPFFYHFEEEAASRGILIDLNKLEIDGLIEEIGNPIYVGLCNHGLKGIKKKVIIDKKNWDRANTMRKELIVFHELGHCVLGRTHDNEQLSNGMCKSIMRSGFSSCLTKYNENRTYYLDELFLD